MKYREKFVPLSVKYASDPAIRRAGEAAELLFIRGLAYAKDHRTEGFIPDYDLEVVGAGLRNLKPRVTALIEHGLWIELEDGWLIRSWLGWNPSNEEVAEDQKRAAGRQAAKRDRDREASHLRSVSNR